MPRHLQPLKQEDGAFKAGLKEDPNFKWLLFYTQREVPKYLHTAPGWLCTAGLWGQVGGLPRGRWGWTQAGRKGQAGEEHTAARAQIWAQHTHGHHSGTPVT